MSDRPGRKLRTKASAQQLKAAREEGAPTAFAPMNAFEEEDEDNEIIKDGQSSAQSMILPMRGTRANQKERHKPSRSGHVSSRPSPTDRPVPSTSSAASSRQDPLSGASRSGRSRAPMVESDEPPILSWADTQSQMRDTLKNGFTRFDVALKSARDTEVPRSRSSKSPNKASERISTAETLSRYHIAGETLARMKDTIHHQFNAALEKLQWEEYNTAVKSSRMSDEHKAKDISQYHEKIAGWQDLAVVETMDGLMNGSKNPLKSLFNDDDTLQPLCSFKSKDQWSNSGIFTAELVAVRDHRGRETSIEDILEEWMEVYNSPSAESDTEDE